MKTRIFVLLVAVLSTLASALPARAQDGSESGRKIVTRIVPKYPSLARSMRIEGRVRADVTVGASGKVELVEVRGGHPLLAQSAQDALRQWKWEAGSKETHEIVELKFNP